MEKVNKTDPLIFIFNYICISNFFFQVKMLLNVKTLLVCAHSFTIVDSKLFIVIKIEGIYVKLITLWTATGKVGQKLYCICRHIYRLNI